MSYGYFASVYNELTENVDYEKIADRIDSLLPEASKNGTVLDLGCGTGTLAFLLEKKGYDVIGIDKSEDMLSAAFSKKFQTGSDVLFLCQDLSDLDLFGTASNAVCTLDTLNHIESEEVIEAFFKKVSLFLEMNGLFLIDMNTPYKHREVLGDNTFVYDADSVYCVWQNTYEKNKKRTQIDLDLFIKNDDDDTYLRQTESFFEYEYEPQVITSLLEKSGFTVLKLSDGYEDKDVSEKTERVLIVAQKNKLIFEGELK